MHPCCPQLPSRIRPQTFNSPVHPQNPAPGVRFGTLPVRHPTPRSRLESGLKRSILHPSRAPCEPQFPTRIRPQALDFARLPRALRPPIPTTVRHQVLGILAVPPATPSSRLESGLKRPILHASCAPSDPSIPTRIRPQALDLAPFPCTLAAPSSRLEFGLKRSILHASRAPSDPRIPTRIRPQALDLAPFPCTLRPPDPA